MVRAILADHNLQGHLQVLFTVINGDETWREMWQELNLSLANFRDLGLAPEAADALLWQVCQQQEIILITANRNADGPNSLEVTLRTRNTADSLPVFTVADAERILHSRDYAERVAARMLDNLLNIDRLRGTGRLYLP